MIPRALLAALLVLALARAGDCGEYALVVNPSSKVSNLSSREVASIFKAQKQSWGWQERIFLILPKSSTEEFAFLLEEVYEMTEAELGRYWIELQYRNKITTRPKSLARGPLTINVVRKKAGAIAILRVEDLPEEGRVKVLRIDNLRPGQAGYPLRDRTEQPEGDDSRVATIPASMSENDETSEQEERIARLESMVDDLLEMAAEETLDEVRFDSRPTLELFGFGHVGYDYESTDGSTNNQFLLGGLDLMIQSQLSESWSFMSEIVFEPTVEGDYVLDVERLIAKYQLGDALNIQAGRFHTSLGYWNENYHHGEWLQTTIGRPDIFEFEDDGGILPVHLVGLSLQGRGDARSGAWDYRFEIGNGRGPTPDPPQIIVDANSSKAINLAAGFSPAALEGFRLGASTYFDQIPALSGVHEDMRERILSVSATYRRAHWLILVEAVRLDHAESGGPNTDSMGFYAQVGRRFGNLTPYMRYDELAIDDANTYFENTNDLRRGMLGLRWDLAQWTALKVQLEHARIDQSTGGAADVNALRLQLSFAF